MPQLDDGREAYLAALLRLDAAGARAVVDDVLAAGAAVADVLLGILQPALNDIGDRWLASEIGIAEEHFATAVTQDLLGALRERMRVPPKDGRLAIVSGSPDEQHALGGQVVCGFLEGDGWEVLWFGAALPAHELARLVDREQPDVVGLSTATVGRLPGVEEALRLLTELRPRPFIALGGRLWTEPLRAEGRRLGGDLVGAGPRELVAALRERFPPVPDDGESVPPVPA